MNEYGLDFDMEDSLKLSAILNTFVMVIYGSNDIETADKVSKILDQFNEMALFLKVLIDIVPDEMLQKAVKQHKQRATTYKATQVLTILNFIKGIMKKIAEFNEQHNSEEGAM